MSRFDATSVSTAVTRQESARRIWQPPTLKRAGSIGQLVQIHKISGGTDNCGGGRHWSDDNYGYGRDCS